MKLSLPVPLARLYCALFGQDPALWTKFFRAVDYTGVACGGWAREDGVGVRELQYVVPLKGLGPKSAETHERQVRRVVGPAGCVVRAEARTPKVPYGESFFTQVQFKLTPTADGAELHVTAKVEFVKSMMQVIQNKICHATYANMKKAYREFVRAPLGEFKLNGAANGGAGKAGATAANGGGRPPRMESWLLKQSKTIKSWNPRWTLVDSKTGVLEWRKSPRDYRPNGFVQLRKGGVEVKVHNPRGDARYDGRVFMVLVAKSVMYFTAETPELAREWVDYLQGIISESNRRMSVSPHMQMQMRGTNGVAPLEVDGSQMKKPAGVVRIMIGQSKNLICADRMQINNRKIKFKLELGSLEKQTRMLRCAAEGVWDETFSFPLDSQQMTIVALESFGNKVASHVLGALYVNLDQFAFDEPMTFWSILKTNPDAQQSQIAGKIQITVQTFSLEDPAKGGGGKLAEGGKADGDPEGDPFQVILGAFKCCMPFVDRKYNKLVDDL